MKDYRSAIKFRASVSVKNKDNGVAELLRKIDDMQRGEVFVGVTEEAGVHLNSKTGMTVLEIATIHEFGLGRNPVRSFIRDWQARFEPTSKRRIAEEWEKVVARKQSASQALNKLGKEFLLSCRQNFETYPFAPNAPRTIQKKGFDKPLFETGQLYSSLTYRIILGNSNSGDLTYAIQFRD